MLAAAAADALRLMIRHTMPVGMAAKKATPLFATPAEAKVRHTAAPPTPRYYAVAAFMPRTFFADTITPPLRRT